MELDKCSGVIRLRRLHLDASVPAPPCICAIGLPCPLALLLYRCRVEKCLGDVPTVLILCDARVDASRQLGCLARRRRDQQIAIGQLLIHFIVADWRAVLGEPLDLRQWIAGGATVQLKN